MAQRASKPFPKKERSNPPSHRRNKTQSMILENPPPPVPSRRRLASPPTATSPTYAPLTSSLSTPVANVRSKSRTESPGDYYVNDEELPPPVPTTPRPRLAGFPQKHPEQPRSQSVDDQLLPVQAEQDTELEALTLCQLVEKYSKFFPVRVQVHKGFYTDRIQIASGDGYNIHFLKQAKVGIINDSIGHEYVIPLNSAIEFGLIYSQPLSSPVTFKSVADILASHNLPKVVCTTKGCAGHDPKSSVEENEVLVITGVHKAKLGLGKMTLKAFSLTKNQDKLLPKECAGSFTTDPSMTRLHLAEIVKYIPDALPVTARMYFNFEDEELELPSHLINEDITLMRQFTETSLVATPYVDPDCTFPVSDTLVDIPVSLDIEVNIIPPERSEIQELYMATREIYQSFNPSKLTTYKDAPTTDAYEAQSQFYSVIWEGHEKEGLQLHKPTMAYVDPDDYELIDFGPLASNRPRLPTPPTLPLPPLPPRESAQTSCPLSQESMPPPPPPPRESAQTSCPLSQESMPPPLPPPREPRSLVQSPPSPQIFQESLTTPLPRPRKSRSSMQSPPSPQIFQESQTTSPPPPREPRNPVQGPPSPSSLSPPQESPTAPLLPPPRESTARAHRRVEIERSISPPGSQCTTEKSSPLSFPELYEDQVLKPVSVQEELSSIRQELNYVTPLVKSLAHTCELLQDEVKELEQRVGELSKAECTVTDSRQRQNRKFLADMMPAQIVQLLEAMGMSDYKETFAKECIDGAVLHECNEEVLENELGIKSKLHRIRLLKVITGDYSPLSILEGGDPYVILDPTQN